MATHVRLSILTLLSNDVSDLNELRSLSVFEKVYQICFEGATADSMFAEL